MSTKHSPSLTPQPPAVSLDGHALRPAVVGTALRRAVLAALTVASGTTLAAAPQYGSHVPHPVGSEPRAVAFVDLNRDGKQDLVTTDFQNDQVSVLIGKANMTFAPAQPFATGARPWGLAVADLNGDARQDLVTANCNGLNISVLLGTRRGTLAAKTDYPVTTGAADCPQGVAVADLNRDGRPDVAVAIETGHAIKILLGLGGGRLGAPTAIADLPAAAMPVNLAVADTNRDGIPDLIAADAEPGTNAVHVLRGLGNGSFQLDASYPVGIAPRQVVAADLNQDGVADLVTANAGLSGPAANGDASVLLGNADGSFQAAVAYEPGVKVRSIALTDTDGDGLLDIVTGNGADANVTVMPGIGGGQFGGAVPFAVGAFTNGVAAADLNRDGRPELAAANQGGSSVSVLENQSPKPAGGTLQAPVNRAAGTGPAFVATSDVDRDGALDLVVTNRTGNKLSVLKGTRSSTVFALPTSVGLPAGITAPTFVAIGDIDRDGKKDLAVAGTGGTALMMGKGNGSFDPGQTFTDRSSAAVAIADLDGNGTPDLVTANPAEDTVTVYRRRITGTYLRAAPYTVGDEPVSLKIADLNRDGRPDIAVANKSGNTISILTQARNRTFVPSLASPAVGISPRSLEIADFNGDSIPDIAVANHDSSSMSLLLGLRIGGFGPAASYAVGAKATGLALADINRDGVLDAALSSDEGAVTRLRVLYGSPNGAFTRSVGVRSGVVLPSIASGDFDGNGTPDLVVANSARNLVSTFLNQ